MRAARKQPWIKRRTLTTLSHPADTMTGLDGSDRQFGPQREGDALGLKRTQLTHSVWPSSRISNLHSPRVFHLRGQPRPRSADAQLDRAVARARDDLAVVGAEGD